MNAVEEKLQVHGHFHFVMKDADGNVVSEWDSPNTIMNLGRNKILDTAIGGATQIATWYMGLIDNAGFSAIAAADTSASHAGWTEYTGISNSVRPTYSPAAAASQSITNAASVAVFTSNSTGTVKGAFIISNSTIGGATGTLLCVAAFSATQPWVSGNTINATYVLND